MSSFTSSADLRPIVDVDAIKAQIEKAKNPQLSVLPASRLLLKERDLKHATFQMKADHYFHVTYKRPEEGSDEPSDCPKYLMDARLLVHVVEGDDVQWLGFPLLQGQTYLFPALHLLFLSAHPATLKLTSLHLDKFQLLQHPMDALTVRLSDPQDMAAFEDVGLGDVFQRIVDTASNHEFQTIVALDSFVHVRTLLTWLKCHSLISDQPFPDLFWIDMTGQLDIPTLVLCKKPLENAEHGLLPVPQEASPLTLLQDPHASVSHSCEHQLYLKPEFMLNYRPTSDHKALEAGLLELGDHFKLRKETHRPTLLLLSLSEAQWPKEFKMTDMWAPLHVTTVVKHPETSPDPLLSDYTSLFGPYKQSTYLMYLTGGQPWRHKPAVWTIDMAPQVFMEPKNGSLVPLPRPAICRCCLLYVGTPEKQGAYPLTMGIIKHVDYAHNQVHMLVPFEGTFSSTCFWLCIWGSCPTSILDLFS